MVHILVVDDDPEIIDLLKLDLELILEWKVSIYLYQIT